jgi:hypothetical protein
METCFVHPIVYNTMLKTNLKCITKCMQIYNKLS